MTRLYLDIETYRKSKYDTFVNERIIAIGVPEDWTPYSEDSLSITSEPEVCFKVFNEKVFNIPHHLLAGNAHDLQAAPAWIRVDHEVL